MFTLYAGIDGGVHDVDEGTGVATEVVSFGAIVDRIVPNPANGKVYASMYNDADTRVRQRSLAGGVWSPVGTAGPVDPSWALASDGTYLYIAHDSGVYRWDYGISNPYVGYGSGLPADPFSFSWNRQSHLTVKFGNLYAGCAGRGLWITN